MTGATTARAGRVSMTTPDRLPVLSVMDAGARVQPLRDEGVQALRGTFMDCAGVLRAKQVSLDRAPVFHSPGLGASPVWVIFCVDDGIAFTPNFGAVGDMRLRTDLDAVADLGNGVAWAPTELADQDGEPLAFCPRGALRREQAAAEAEGLQVSAATEIEFVAFDGVDDAVAGRGGPAYGLAPLLEHASFVEEVHTAFARAGLVVEQFHAEYSSGQFEMSLAPPRRRCRRPTPTCSRGSCCATRRATTACGSRSRRGRSRPGSATERTFTCPSSGTTCHSCRVGPVRTGLPTTAPRSSPATSSGCLRWSEDWRHRCCPGCASSRAIGPGRTRAGVWRTARRPFACAPRRRATSGARAPR